MDADIADLKVGKRLDDRVKRALNIGFDNEFNVLPCAFFDQFGKVFKRNDFASQNFRFDL